MKDVHMAVDKHSFNIKSRKPYQICSRCVMDTSDEEISFDQNGICNHCHQFNVKFQSLPFLKQNAKENLEIIVDRIKRDGKGRDYDAVMGLSGGVDSSYVAYLAKQFGLRPLVVHFDNGWNSELAIKNIENIVNKLKYDLYTYVINWEEFREIQIAFFKAGVLDIEMITDHAITAVVFNAAKKNGIKYILGGSNLSTEGILPRSWLHRKTDLRNLMAIYKKYGTLKLREFPTASTIKIAFMWYVLGIKPVYLLNHIKYIKNDAMQILVNELGWQYYGGKHYESVFTRFYQGYILPVKYGIDKRRAHFSTLINSSQLERTEALAELEKQKYPDDLMHEDRIFVLKKLKMSADEFDIFMKTKPVPHEAFASDETFYKILNCTRNTYRKLFS